MKPEIIVYSKSNCPQCDLAKKYLNKKNLHYIEVSLDDALERDSFVMLFPGIRSMPQIVVNNNRVGGLNELMALNFDQKSCLTLPFVSGIIDLLDTNHGEEN